MLRSSRGMPSDERLAFRGEGAHVASGPIRCNDVLGGTRYSLAFYHYWANTH